MARTIFDPAREHAAIAQARAGFHADTIAEVQAAIDAHDVVIVGMAQNPFPRRARKFLDARNQPYHYLEYGSYLSQWKKRLALKMWVGWPTIPMIFVKGTFIGGAEDLERLAASGELDGLLAG